MFTDSEFVMIFNESRAHLKARNESDYNLLKIRSVTKSISSIIYFNLDSNLRRNGEDVYLHCYFGTKRFLDRT